MQLAFTKRLDIADNLNHKLHCMSVNQLTTLQFQINSYVFHPNSLKTITQLNLIIKMFPN